MGQGIKTSLAQLCAAQLGLDPVAIEVTAGDTAHISCGMGGFASRQSVRVAGVVDTVASCSGAGASNPDCHKTDAER